MRCALCGATPVELFPTGCPDEVDPVEWCRQDGTYSREGDQFLCDRCYIVAGSPVGEGGRSWKATPAAVAALSLRGGLEGQADAATEWWGAALWPDSHPWAAWGRSPSQEEAERALRASLADGITREVRARFRGALRERLHAQEGISQTLAVVGKPWGVLRGALREAGLPLSPGILPGRASMSIVWGARTVATLGRIPRSSLVWGAPSWESSRGLCGEQAPTVGRASPARKCGLPAFHLGKCAYTEPCSLCVACGRVEADPAHQGGSRGHQFRPLPLGRSFWNSSRE